MGGEGRQDGMAPKEMREQNYADDRPAEYFEQFYEQAATKEPGFVYQLVRMVLTPPTIGLYRTRAIATENVPASGPVLLAPNHFSQMDHFFAAVYLRRKVRFMAKSQLFGAPVLTGIVRNGGVFPVRRGHRDERAFETAYAILDRGGTLLVYAEGGRSRTRNLGEPRPGIGRIALETGVPVVPVAIHGSAGVRSFRRFRFPKVTIQYGEPVSFPVEEAPSKERTMDVSREIFDRVRTMYTALEEQGREGVLRSLRDGIAPAQVPGETSGGRYS